MVNRRGFFRVRTSHASSIIPCLSCQVLPSSRPATYQWYQQMNPPMKVMLTVVMSALCVIGCKPSPQSEVRSTFRPDPPAHGGVASQGAPSATPVLAPATQVPRLHVSQNGITLNDVRLDDKLQAASLPGGDIDAFFAGLREMLTRERQGAGSSEDAVPTEAHYALTVEPNVPFRLVKWIMRASAWAGHVFVHLSCGETTFDFLVDERPHSDTEPLVEMHELGIRVDNGAVSASVFRAAPSSINRGMFERALRIERSLPRLTSYIALSEFALAITDLASPDCSDPSTPCFDRLALDADDNIPFGEITSILAAMDSGLRPAIALPWTAGAFVVLSPFRIGSFYPGGYLPSEQIYPVIRQNLYRTNECYADALRRNPKLTGVVRVQFKIDLEGKVIDASEAPEPSADATAQAQNGSPLPTIHDPKMVSCVLSEFAKFQFARPERGGSRVKYNIPFAP